MKKFNIMFATAALLVVAGLTSCKKDKDSMNVGPSFDTAGTYTQVDQMGRPAVNTVFVGSARKNEFNTTVPASMSAKFKADFMNVLSGFGFTSNALGQNKDQFAGLLASDVLTVKMNGTTTFFDGTNVLTGRALADDVIDVELLLIFGGSTGASNPSLTSDNVNGNDKPFSSTFPYLASPF